MSKWSEELQETTRMEVFPGAIMKDEDHNYGIFFEINGNVVIKGIVPGSGLMPKASDEIIGNKSNLSAWQIMLSINLPVVAEIWDLWELLLWQMPSVVVAEEVVAWVLP